MDLNFVQQLLSLPLFQGMQPEDLKNLFNGMNICIQDRKKDSVIAEQYKLCNQLIFIVSGKVRIETTNDTYQYKLLEDIPAPMVLQPECLFGRHTHFTHSYFAHTDTTILCIKKELIVKYLFDYDVFRFNLLNILCSHIQRQELYLWRSSRLPLPERFAQFILNRSTNPAGSKTLKIKMTDLATQLNTTRLNVSQMLHQLSKKQLVQMYRGTIFIPSLNQLITTLS